VGRPGAHCICCGGGILATLHSGIGAAVSMVLDRAITCLAHGKHCVKNLVYSCLANPVERLNHHAVSLGPMFGLAC
jgi:hypothetical protein